MPPVTAITEAPLSVEAVLRAVEGPGAGAVTTFIGLVRDHNVGRTVLWLDYEAYAPLAEKALARHRATRPRQRWTGARMAIHHRTGRLEIGEASVVIAVATPHRADAFARAATPSSASSRSCRSGSTNTSRAARCGSRARRPMPTTRQRARRR